MNKLTLLVDGGWVLMRTMFFFERGFRMDASKAQKSATAAEFKETLSRSITKILNQIPEIDNIVIMSEGGSWRKNLPIPKQLQGVSYKGHRERKEQIDWDAIYKAYGEFVKDCDTQGVTCSAHSSIEGDDWAWYWSRRLNASGVNTIIWSSDCDLKQLVQVYGNAFTAWYNDKAGLVLPDAMQYPDDPVEAMMNPPFQNQESEKLIRRLKKVQYINPDMIAIEKILCGDAGDNIKSVVRFTKNGRTYRFAEADYKKLIGEYNIQSMNDLFSHKSDIARYITENKKFKPYGFNTEDIEEMLDYNTSLVWLNESTIPDTVTTAMVQFEYKDFDVASVRSNHKLLTTANNDIADIYNQIPGLC